MWAVLSQDLDVDARWIAAGLEARTDRPVALVTAGSLVHDCRWEHRVGRSGTASRLLLGDGTVVDSAGLGAVLNRLCWLGAEGYAGASDRDGEYAGGELYALGLSWLESLGPRVHPADGRPVPARAEGPAGDRSGAGHLHDVFSDWMELSPGRVMNKAAAMASNGSKPYQAQLIRSVGFGVPETLITDQPDLVRDFLATHGRVVYKSSGVRSIVQELEGDALDRLDDIRWCPVQFQAYVEGIDVRVHVIGEEVFATQVASAATDYRYAGVRDGIPARLEATRLSWKVEQRCIDLTARLGGPHRPTRRLRRRPSPRRSLANPPASRGERCHYYIT